MRDYRAKRLEQETSQTTVNRELQVIRRAYKYAASQEPPKIRFIPRFEMASEKDNPRKVFMSEEVKQRLKDAAAREGLWARLFLEMIFSLGWRKGEVIGLRVSNVHLAENFIRIETSKTGEPREVPLNDSLRVLLEPLVIGKNPDEPLFPVKDVRYAWRRICKAAGVKAGRAGYIPHDARRTAARTQRAAQVP
jgi:integrase